MCHANDAATVIHEIIAFNNAVKIAYDFAQSHPEETLIIVTGDHETGGLTLGFANMGYQGNPDRLKFQTCSSNKLYTYIREALEGKETPSLEDVKPILAKYLSFKFDGPADDPMTITPIEKLQLEKACTQQFSGEKKYKSAIGITAIKIFNAKAGIAWNTGSHSALPVITSAYGVGADIFNKPEFENCFISQAIKSLLKN